MAIIHKGILSFFYDKKYKRKLAYYMGKSIERPSNSKSTRPVTEKQLAQRLKFALAIKFVTAIKLITAIGFKQVKKRGISPTNIALQKLLKKSIIGEYPDFKIDYRSVQISSGNLSSCYIVDLTLAEPNTIEMSWVIGNNWREDHRFHYHFIHVLLYDEQVSRSWLSWRLPADVTASYRSAYLSTWKAPVYIAGFFYRQKITVACPTAYISENSFPELSTRFNKLT